MKAVYFRGPMRPANIATNTKNSDKNQKNYRYYLRPELDVRFFKTTSYTSKWNEKEPILKKKNLYFISNKYGVFLQSNLITNRQEKSKRAEFRKILHFFEKKLSNLLETICIN